jgi:Tol biopolymer transport system component
MNANGSGSAPLTKLTALGADSFDPAWSPDSSKIAFDSSRALDKSDAALPAANTWIVNSDGSGATALTNFTDAGVTIFNPQWSLDGAKIAFAAVIVSPPIVGSSFAITPTFIENIWVMNADGSGATPLTQLTAVGAASDAPAWQP